MTDYRMKLFAEAAHVAENRSSSIKEALDSSDAHLRYAALRILEGHEQAIESLVEHGTVMVAYGDDVSQHRKYGGKHEEWWEGRDPVRFASRIRIVTSEEALPNVPLAIMEALDTSLVHIETEASESPPQIEGGNRVYHFIMNRDSRAVQHYEEWLRASHEDGEVLTGETA